MKKVLRVIIPLLLAAMMILPMAAFAEDAAITGYAFEYDSTLSKDGGYRSYWTGPNAVFSQASYATWIKSEGSFQGPFQWSPSIKSKSTLDTENGILTFRGVGDGNIQINPVENGKMAAGVQPFFVGFDTKPTTGDYSGMLITAIENSKDHTAFWIDTEGKIYWGATDTAGNVKVPTGKELVMDEWNTVMLYFIPKLSKDDPTVATGYTVYMDAMPTARCAKGWGISDADLAALPSHDWSGTKVFVTGNNKMLIKGYQPYQTAGDKTSPETAFNLRDFRTFRMKADQPLYRMAFTGYSALTAYVPQASNNDTSVITVPTVEGVNYWVNSDAEFLTPGDTKTVTASKEYGVATGEQEAIASLMSAVTRLDEAALAAGTYSYEVMSASYDEISGKLEDTLASGAVSDQPGGNNYSAYERANQRLEELDTLMQEIADNGELLIEAAKTFGDEDAELDERIAAYEEVKDLPIDETYSAECRNANIARNIFTATYLEIANDYQSYKDNRGKLLVEHTEEEWRELLTTLIGNITVIKESGSNFTPDEMFVTRYEEYLTSQAARVKAATTLMQKYLELERLVNLYNAYHDGLDSRSKTVAPAVQEAMDDYNNTVARLNAEIVTAAKIATSCSLEVTSNTAFGKYVAYVTATVNKATPLPTKSKEN